jgi:hypothetical protein
VISWGKKVGGGGNTRLEKLQSTIRSCGVSFDIWEKINEDGNGSGQHDFTSLLGQDKKKLLAELPHKLTECLMPEKCDVVINIWKDFHELYRIMTSNSTITPEIYNSFFQKAKNWINLFTSLRTSSIHKGYGRASVTPYMHSLVYHVPRFMQLY